MQYTIQLNPATISVLLPVGISFYTFQTLSYTIDVYRKKIKPQKHLGIFAVYVSFFPQLVAGPIERAKHLMPQFFEKHNINYTNFSEGFRLMLWGFFKKVVIADRLAILVDIVYSNPGDFSGGTIVLATVFFAFQIFCDFSGYTDIAIGSAKIMGFDLMQNFRRPYFSKSISEFWKRWHISLSTWFRDYLYIPLGGNKVSKPKWLMNIMIVFLVSGLWHGAGWNFVVWGALHGVYLILEIVFKPLTERFKNIFSSKWIYNAVSLTMTFILANIAWVFFRANSATEGGFMIQQIFSTSLFSLSTKGLGLGLEEIIVSFFLIGIMEAVHIAQETKQTQLFYTNKFFRWGSYLTLILIILLIGVFDSYQFIYFQF